MMPVEARSVLLIHFLFCLPGHAVFSVTGIMYYSPNERIWLFPGMIAHWTVMAEFPLCSFQKTEVSFIHDASYPDLFQQTSW